MRRFIIGIPGDSRPIDGVRILQTLRGTGGIETHRIMSGTAKLDAGNETDRSAVEIEAIAGVTHAAGRVLDLFDSGRLSRRSGS